MRSFILVSLALLLVASGAARSAEPDFNFGKLMEEIEADTNELQTSIAFEDSESALDFAHRLDTAFGKVEGFFAGWGYAEDAVSYSRQYREMASDIARLVTAHEFEAAYDKTLEFSGRCKSCHDSYKPL